MITQKQRIKAAKIMMSAAETPLIQVDFSKMSCQPKWMTRLYKNNKYCVMIDDFAKTDKGDAIRVFVQRWDDLPIPRHWSEMQRIKNIVFGREAMAIEYYPPESKLVNSHNIYWMWVFDDSILPTPII